MTDAMTSQLGAQTTPSTPEPEGGAAAPARSVSYDAWRKLRKNPLFWVSSVLIVLFVTMAIFPGLFTNLEPNEVAHEVREDPFGNNGVFGSERFGYDIYAQTIYGARASILVGLFTTLATGTMGVLLGTMAGYFGGWVDAVVSRLADLFFAIPLLLGAILFMTTFASDENTPYFAVVGKVVIALAILGWPGVFRLMRATVMQVKPAEYVQAARALGATTPRIIYRHIIPNALGPVIAYSTINLGVYIVVEATMSFLGIGLVPPTVSWGVAISDALEVIYAAPHALFFPAAALSLCVLSFIMLGDAVTDAFDPRSQSR